MAAGCHGPEWWRAETSSTRPAGCGTWTSGCYRCAGPTTAQRIITDRDIVIRCVADGNDPGTTTAGSLCDGPPVTIGADDPVEDVLSTMAGIRCGGCR